MCVIAICSDRKLTVEEIDLMHTANPHGAGIAWINPRGKTVEYLKGLTRDEVVTKVARLPLPQVVHFRLASAGGTSPLLTHPFPLTGAAPLDLAGAAPSVLFHNGHWTGWILDGMARLRRLGGYVDPQEPWSDTRAMAALMQYLLPGQVATLAGQFQRLAILHATGKVELYGEFVKHHGLLVSNLWWLPRALPAYTPAWLDDDQTESWEDPDEPLCAPPLPRKPRRAKGKGKGKRREQKPPRKAAKARQEAIFVVPEVPRSRYFPAVPRPTRPSYRAR
jgi:hypothetical protein